MGLRGAFSIAVLALVPSVLGCSVLFTYDDLVGDAGAAAGCASTCGTPGCGDCPDMPQIDVPASASTPAYRIDAYEVRNADYEAWLQTSPTLSGQRSECADWNDSYAPGVIGQKTIDALKAAGKMVDGCTTALDSGPKQPVTCIDWCDAAAYCIWAQKRLCGAIAGGTLDVTDVSATAYVDATASQWYRACSEGGVRAYPYGTTYEMGWCNDSNSRITAVDAFPQCQGGYTGIYGMSGNVSEWEDACTAYAQTVPPAQNCLRRGGAFWNTEAELACNAPASLEVRGLPNSTVGFRCCSGPG